MSKAEELRRLARQLDDESIDWHDYQHVAAALREYAESLEREPKPVDNHDSDCATHNMPAYPNDQCDCRLAHSNPPRSEPPKMTESDVRNMAEWWPSFDRAGVRLALAVADLRDKQWRGDDGRTEPCPFQECGCSGHHPSTHMHGPLPME